MGYKFAIVCIVLVSWCYGQLLSPLVKIPDAVLETMPLEVPATQCNEIQLNYCQTTFNNQTGIDNTLTWRNATVLYNLTDIAMSQSVNALLNVCLNRRNFYSCLAGLYSACTNRYWLLSKLPPGGSLFDPFVYGAMWQQLDFECNAGLEKALSEWRTLTGLYGDPSSQSCIATFLIGVDRNPTDLCSLSSTYMNCMQNVYNNRTGDNASGWWICERIRFGYAYDCPNLRCLVNP